jgi:hypothetical protein
MTGAAPLPAARGDDGRGAIVGHDGHEPSLVITAFDALILMPQVRRGCEALAGIAAMHRAAGLRHQALAAAVAMHRLDTFYQQLDALASHVAVR